VSSYTNGTGHYLSKKYLLDDGTFDPTTGSINFESRNVGFSALLYELRDGNGGVVNDSPNWFGVAVPEGITDYRNVVIYFHPSTGQGGALYDTRDYLAKSGAHGTNWKELYSYVERLGKQLAGAAKFAPVGVNTNNQILIFPFMRDFPSAGLLSKYWYNFVMDILDDLYTNGAN
jgi:hypothetical protein